MDLLLIILASVAVVLLLVILVLVVLGNNKNKEVDTTDIKDLIKDENSKLSNNFVEENGELRLKIAEAINKSNRESIGEMVQFKDVFLYVI